GPMPHRDQPVGGISEHLGKCRVLRADRDELETSLNAHLLRLPHIQRTVAEQGKHEYRVRLGISHFGQDRGHILNVCWILFVDQYFDIAIFQSRQEKTSDLSGRGDLIGKDCSGRYIIALGKLDKLNGKSVVDGWRHKPNVTWFEFSDVHRRSR